MTQTVFGELFNPSGLASTQELVQGPDKPELRFKAWASPGLEVRRVQAARIPVDLAHDHRWVGELIYLERSREGRVTAVAHVDDQVLPITIVRVGDRRVPVETEMFFSAERVGTEDWQDIIVRSVGLTASTARLSARPVQFRHGSLDYRQKPPSDWELNTAEKELLTRACEAHREHRQTGGPLVVHDWPLPKPGETAVAARSTGPIQYRSAQVADVTTSLRQIELVIAPCETLAAVPYQGRMIHEVYGFGCFAGVEHHPERVRVNRDHRVERTVGVAVELDPYDDQGLVGTIRLARTDLADESLELARDGCLDASAGFRILADKWQGREIRRVTKGDLVHIALTPEPAYQDARVLAVRGQA